MEVIRRFSQDGMHKKDTEIRWQSTILAKKKSCFSIASLLKDDYTAARAERSQNAKHWILLRLSADGSQIRLRQRPEFAAKVKQCLKMQDAQLAETQQSLRPIRPEHQQRSNVNDKISNSKEEKTSITMSIGKLDGGTTESHGETRWQHLHLQLRSGQLHNGKRVGTHGNLHHLKNGGDFGYLEGIPENRRWM